MPKLSYEAWFKEVDLTVGRLVGLSVRDLPDYPFRDAYEDGKSPARVAKAVVKAASE